MSDVTAVNYMLAHNSALTAVVPAARIKSGLLPEGTPLPAIAVTHITGMRRKMVNGSIANTFCTCRVQITVHATSYPQQKSMLTLVRAALPNTRGSVNGVAVDSILHELDGPDGSDEQAGIYQQSVDYMVRFTE
jgi:hypothetical protein